MRLLKTKNPIFLLLFSFCFSSFSFAQKAFVEGELSYLISIEKDNQILSDGKLKLSLKGNNVLKELVLNSGFKNKILYIGNENAYYALKVLGKENLAIQLNAAEQEEKKMNCKNLRVEKLDSENKVLKNLKTEKAYLYCDNAKPILITYTKEWSIGNENLFDYFPKFGFLPIAFQIVKEDGSVIKFELDKIEDKPLDNACVSIPKGFKKITNEEFKTWQH